MPATHRVQQKAQMDSFKDREIVVKLCNGTVVRGMLVDTDNFMNMSMRDCVDQNGQSFKSCFIRGNAIISIQ